MHSVHLSRMLAAYTLIREPGPNIGTKIFIPVTNAIESLNRVIRKTTNTRGSFLTDDAATKLIYLASCIAIGIKMTASRENLQLDAVHVGIEQGNPPIFRGARQ